MLIPGKYLGFYNEFGEVGSHLFPATSFHKRVASSLEGIRGPETAHSELRQDTNHSLARSSMGSACVGELHQGQE